MLLRGLPLVSRALGRWVVGTRGGRKLAAVAAIVVVGGLLVVGGDTKRSGSWSGLSNQIAPTKGAFTITGAPGKSARCTVRGQTGTARGDGWIFRGNTKLAETSCEGRIEKNGEVTAALTLKVTWKGRVKGIGGDWEDVDGACTCEGELTGTLSAGGEWEGKCKQDETEWDASISWKLDA